MKDERWRKIQELYHSALQVVEDQRPAFLNKVCADDDAVRQEVESLLAYHARAKDFISVPAFELAADFMMESKTNLSEALPGLVGRTISHYRVVQRLGGGGMGVVYKAEDMRLHRYVALKFLRQDVARNPQALARFQREAQAASALNHPSICTIYEIDCADGINFIAMEFVAGKTLDQLILRHGLQRYEVLKYSVQITDALASAHVAGIVHRDLKPGNVMVTDRGLVKVLDFGVAKLIEAHPLSDEQAAPTLQPTTEEGVILGTVSYMSPEQAEGRNVDARSDIFSFGALLYEMVTGRKAFQGNSHLSTLSAILHDEPKPAGQVIEGLPPELETIIGRCLRKLPERRFQAMPDLKVALEELKENLDSGTRGMVSAPPRRHPWLLPWGIALLVSVGTIAVLLFVRLGTRAPTAALTAVPLTTYPGFQGEPTFSPDGNQVAFTWDGETRDNIDIYIKLIGTSAPPLRLTSNPAADYCPNWSPDGRFIAFIRKLAPERSAVLLIPALRGTERKIGEIAGGIDSCMSWTPDGTSLVISDRMSSAEPLALFLLSIETGDKQKLTFPPAQSLGDCSPAFSPDGRTLVFSRAIDLTLSDLYMLTFTDRRTPAGETKRLTFDNHGATSPAWTADGHEVIFADYTGGMSSLLRIAPRASGQVQPQRLEVGEHVAAPAISRGGQRQGLAYSRGSFDLNVWRVAVSPSLNTGSSFPNATRAKATGRSGATPFISSTREDYSPQFSPDGKRITFVSNHSGTIEIWVCDSDASNPVQLTSFRGPEVTTPRWSPDGARIAFDSNAEGEFDIWIISANGGKPQRMTYDLANDGNPSWSRDGRWIYFDSARTGAQQVWKIPANGGEAIQVTHDGGFAPIESPDGRFLYYVTNLIGASLLKMPVEGGPATKILEGLDNYLNLAVVDKGVYFVPSSGTTNGSSIQFFSLATHQMRLISNIRKTNDFALSGLAVSPDGKWILYTQADQVSSELMLVEDFR
jgi:eukaryotic-like serine/threonine-protein kinase